MSFASGTRAGMRAQATCLVQEGDQPLTMAWRKDGQPLNPGPEVRVSQVDSYTSILVIESASARHSANYTCVATNPAKTTTTTAALAVRGKFLWFENLVNQILALARTIF